VAAPGRIGRMARYAAELEQPPRASPASRAAFGHVRSSVLAFAGLGLVTARSRHGWLGELDRAAISTIRNGRSAAAVTAARAVSALAEPGIAAFPLAAAVIVALRRAGWRAACAPCLTVASGVVVRRSLSRAIARPRPPSTLWLTEPEGFSFPSKHTALAALTAGACASGIGAAGLTRDAAPLLAAAGVGAGRVYLGVHWPSDVLAGWLFAAGWLHLAEAMLSALTHAGAGCPRRQ
jgi:membrane-associated phospholipid phosphatase